MKIKFAIKNKKNRVTLFESRKRVDLSIFSDFVPSEAFMLKTSQLKDASKEIGFDCFLAHEWGTPADNFATHQKVLAISQLLGMKGFKVWVDQNNLSNDVAGDIVIGLARSRKVVFFITTRYLERSNDADTNCAKELKCAVAKGRDNLVVVLLDEEAQHTNTWAKTVAGYHLGGKLYIDLSSNEKVEANLEELCNAIRN